MSGKAISEAWADGMLQGCWQGGLCIFVAWVASRTILKRAPGLRQAIWWLACLKLLTGMLPLRPLELSVLPPPVSAASPFFASAVAKPDVADLATSPATAALPWESILCALWLIGIAAKLIYGGRKWQGARRLLGSANLVESETLRAELREVAVRNGLGRPPRLIESSEIASPCVIGLVRPSVLIPAGFERDYSPEERRMAMAHEVAHLRRGDLWLSIVPSLADLFFFFLPPVWLAVREWATEREAACDRAAVLATGANPKRYGELLLRLIRKESPTVFAGLGATSDFHTLRRRLTSVFEPQQERMPGIQGVATGGIGAFLIVPLTLTSPVADLPANGGMELGRNVPQGWTAKTPDEAFELTWDKRVSHSGTHSLSISRESDRFWPIAEWSHEIPYRPGQAPALEFGAFIRAQRVRKAVLDVQFQDAQGEWTHAWAAYIGAFDDSHGPADHDWATYSGVVTIPPQTHRVRVALQDYGKGTIWIDDAFVRFVGPQTAALKDKP